MRRGGVASEVEVEMKSPVDCHTACYYYIASGPQLHKRAQNDKPVAPDLVSSSSTSPSSSSVSRPSI